MVRRRHGDANADAKQRAIALSLQDHPGPSAPPHARSNPNVIEISDDEDDAPDRVTQEDLRFQDELERAIEASKREVKLHDEPQPTVHTTAASKQESPGPAVNFLSERAKLEQERLARQKRLRPDLDIDGSPSRSEDAHRSKRHHLSPPSAETRRTDMLAYSSAASSRSAASTSATSTSIPHGGSPTSEPWFWNGEMRQIANMHVDRAKDTKPTFRLTDLLAPVSHGRELVTPPYVLQREEIEFAIVSAYVYNFPWLYSMFPPKTPVIAVAQDPQGRTFVPHFR